MSRAGKWENFGPMSFFASANAYDRFMGRYSTPLAPQLADLAGITDGQRVLDVGCGPGALTGELVSRVGASAVSAVDPSAPFVAAASARHPGVTVVQASAEALPFADDAFDASLAQLVVHFMRDSVAGLAEMRRVTRPDGVVAACVWDHAGDSGPLGSFWAAVRAFDPDAHDEGTLPGTIEGQLVELFEAAGLRRVEGARLAVALTHPTFEDWWEPYTGGIGPAGAYVSSLSAERRTELRERCRVDLGPPPFTIAATAWAARGLA